MGAFDDSAFNFLGSQTLITLTINRLNTAWRYEVASHAVTMASFAHVRPVIAAPCAKAVVFRFRVYGCPPRIEAVGLYRGGPAWDCTPVHRKSQIYTDPSRDEVVTISSVRGSCRVSSTHVIRFKGNFFERCFMVA